MLTATYDPSLVICSIFIAAIASYSALALTERIVAAHGVTRHFWLCGGAIALGLGIWSMHFVGMLAFRLPIQLDYNANTTGISLLIAIGSAYFALWTVQRTQMSWRHLLMGALPLGSGVAAMHYVGMAAMEMDPGITYSLPLFAASIVIAVIASGAALKIAFLLRSQQWHVLLFRVLASVVMGAGISGMHYTGMAAASFQDGAICRAAAGSDGLSQKWLAVLVIIVALAVLGLALIVSVLDMRLEARTATLNASLAQANRELTQLALYDVLTGLPNRTLLEDRLAQAVLAANRQNSRFALLFLDLDGFKQVNDAYNHHVGDMLLVAITNHVKTMLRPQDTLARLSGDEFVLVLDSQSIEDVAKFAAGLVDAVDRPFIVEGHALHVTASVGVAIFPTSGSTGSDLLVNADVAMYHAKASGRNGYAFFEPLMNADAQEQLQLLNDLRLALGRHEFILHYQPKFDFPSGAIGGAEALLRWNHPTRGLVPPDKFIPIAERAGLIIPIGEWVIDEACRQLSTWHASGHAWSIAVNVSPLQLRNDGIVKILSDAIARHDVPANRVVLEITETTAMSDAETTVALLHKIAAIGVKISIDDFGTGYSNLMQLKRLPAVELKIDRGFILNLVPHGDDAAIVSSIMALAKSLHLRTVAEGVETEGQQQLLRELGCDTMQGFLLSQPLRADEFLAFANRTQQEQQAVHAAAS